MSRSNRQAAGTRTTAAWRAIGALIVAAAVLASLSGCASATTSPSASGPAGSGAAPVATPVPTATAPAYADTLRIGWPAPWDGSSGGFPRGWNQGELSGVSVLSFGRLVYSGLYRWDAHDSPVPDLADGPCLPQADPKILRCRLIQATFQDGTPVTADDVAYTYQLFHRDTLRMFFASPSSFAEVRVVDPLTVDFVLAAVDPTFVTDVLPLIPIFPRHAVETAVANFVSRTKGLKADDLVKLSDTINEEVNRDPPVCSDARLAEVDGILERAGAAIQREDFKLANGTFDACRYLGMVAGTLSADSAWDGLGWILDQAGLDQAAGVFRWKAAFDPFVGTGPYRYVSQTVDRVHFEAWPGYHGGLAATRYVDFVLARDDGSDLAGGTVDIFPGANLGTAYQATAPEHGVRGRDSADPGVCRAHVQRPARGVSSPTSDLRKALQLCIDLPRDVDAATGGGGTPVYGPVLPGSWGDDPQPAEARPGHGRREAAHRGRGLAARRRRRLRQGWGPASPPKIVVNAAAAARIKMADLIAGEARDCGMDLTSLPLDRWSGIQPMLQLPARHPGHHDAIRPLPGPLDHRARPGGRARHLHVVAAPATPSTPTTPNIGGFSDPAFDRLMVGRGCDLRPGERTRIYRQAQEELASQVPAIFLWAANGYDALRSAVTTVDGPLDLTAPNWAWQPERVVVASP